MDGNEEKQAAPGYGTLVVVWAVLLGLTGLTLGASGLGMASFVILAPILIASVKAFLVVDYFMRLRYEPAFFKYILLVVLGMVVVTVFLVYQDVAYRY